MPISASWPGAARRRAVAAVAGLALLCSAPTLHGRDTTPDAPADVRGLWVLRSSLTSPQRVLEMVRAARTSGFNTLFVQVRGRGEAYYSSAIEPRASDLATQPLAFDPLAETIDAAHAAGLRVHAWVNVNLVSSAHDLPDDRGHVVYRHPDWLMVPRAIVQELAAVEGHSPAYAGKISRWVRGQSAVEGLYLSPVIPEAAAYTEAVVSELARRYDLDGVHLDYIRYPGAAFDYSRYAIAEFRDEVIGELPAARRAELDGLALSDPLAWPDSLPDRWSQFRRARLTALAMRLRTAVKAARPSAMVTAAVAPDFVDAFTGRLQDWRTWLETGILDAVCPMAYTTDASLFAQQIVAAREMAGERGVWAGIGAWRLTPAQTIQHIALARKAGAGGLVLFSYDSLTGPAQLRADYLDEIARAAFQTRGGAATGNTR
jgi:uncharacterized lipoprotein YddW (UPF0748 family)